MSLMSSSKRVAPPPKICTNTWPSCVAYVTNASICSPGWYEKRENNNTLLHDTIHNSYNLWVCRQTSPRQCELSFSLNISSPHPLVLFLLLFQINCIFQVITTTTVVVLYSLLPQNNVIIKLYYCLKLFHSIESSPSTCKVLYCSWFVYGSKNLVLSNELI